MKLDRRSFIRLIPVLAVAVVGGSWWFLRQTAREPTIASQATATTTKAFDFPVTWNGDRPTMVNLNDYRLKVDGDVSNPLELTLEDLHTMPSVQRTLRIQCVEGWRAWVPWEGVLLSHLLSLAGASLEKIAHITVESVTGYNTTISSDEIANSDSMMALKAGGVPLTVEHGYPARLVAPTKLGLDWVKYVRRITCTSK